MFDRLHERAADNQAAKQREDYIEKQDHALYARIAAELCAENLGMLDGLNEIGDHLVIPDLVHTLSTVLNKHPGQEAVEFDCDEFLWVPHAASMARVEELRRGSGAVPAEMRAARIWLANDRTQQASPSHFAVVLYQWNDANEPPRLVATSLPDTDRLFLEDSLLAHRINDVLKVAEGLQTMSDEGLHSFYDTVSRLKSVAFIPAMYWDKRHRTRQVDGDYSRHWYMTSIEMALDMLRSRLTEVGNIWLPPEELLDGVYQSKNLVVINELFRPTHREQKSIFGFRVVKTSEGGIEGRKAVPVANFGVDTTHTYQELLAQQIERLFLASS